MEQNFWENKMQFKGYQIAKICAKGSNKATLWHLKHPDLRHGFCGKTTLSPHMNVIIADENQLVTCGMCARRQKIYLNLLAKQGEKTC